MNAKKSLLEAVKEDSAIKRYKELEKHVQNDPEINQKMRDLKDLQVEIVHAREFNKKALLSQLQVKYDQLFDEITNYPLISEYMALQGEINQMIQDVTDIISDGLDPDFDGKAFHHANIGKKDQIT
jgi:cell fate (sporulation/competence/biofilm development) regulator YmcA (YheA/YmcA/DUF963 family)